MNHCTGLRAHGGALLQVDVKHGVGFSVGNFIVAPRKGTSVILHWRVLAYASMGLGSRHLLMLLMLLRLLILWWSASGGVVLLLLRGGHVSWLIRHRGRRSVSKRKLFSTERSADIKS